LCNTSSTTLAGNTPTTGTGTWSVVSGTATITTPSSPTSSVTGLVSGSTAVLRWTISNGACSNSTDEVSISVATTPSTANAGPDQTLCNANTATLAGNTPAVGTGTWTISSGTATITDPNDPSTTITGLTPGSPVTMKWTISNGSCISFEDEVTITNHALPTTANAGSNQNLCNTTTTTLAGNTPTVGTGSWSVISGTASVTTPSSPTSGVTGLTIGGNSLLRWTISNGSCPSSTSDVTINSYQTPTTANAGTNQNLCNVTTTTLAGNTPAAGTGTWTVVGGSATITSPSSPNSGITGLTIGSTATLRWTISNGSCADSFDEVDIIVSSPPTASNAGPNQNLCNTTTSTLAANNPGVGSGSWSVISGSASITDNTDPASGVTGLTIGSTSTLRWTITNGNCTSASDVIISVDDLPTVADAGTDQSICSSSATLAGNTPTVGTGTWTKISGSGNITTPPSPSSGITGLTAGTSTFRWTISNGACASSFDEVDIANGSVPTVDAGPDQELCNTSTGTLAGNTPSAGSGAWSVITGGATVDNPTDENSTVSSLSTGVNTFRWTITDAGCVASDDISITVYNTPTASNAGSDQSVCTTTATLAGNTPTDGTGLWTVQSGSATITDDTNPSTTITALTPGTSVVMRWTISNGVCAPSFSDVTITVDQSPTTADAGVDQTLCNVTSTNLAGNTAIVGTGTWTVESGTATITDINDENTPITGLTPGTDVTLRWTIANGTCPDSFDEITVFNSEPPTVSSNGGNQNLCNVTTTTLTGNTPTVGTGIWSVTSGSATITDAYDPTSDVTGLSIGGSATLEWTISNGFCPSSSSSVTITVDDNPTIADAGENQGLCNVSTSSLAGNTPSIGTGLWSIVSGPGAVTTPSSPTSGVTGLVFGTPTTYRWTISNGSCPDSFDEITISTDEPPTTANAGSNQTLCNTTATTLDGNPATVGTGNWTLLSGTATITDASDPTTTVTGLIVGDSATFRWRITNGNCPASSSTVKIKVDALPTTANAGTDQGLCNVTTTTLDGNNPTIGSGLWTVSSGTATISSPTSPTSGVTGLVAGSSAVLRWTISNGVCPDSFDEVTIDNGQNPDAADAGLNQDLCNTTTTTLAANTPAIGTGAWSVVSGTATITDSSDPATGVTGLTIGGSSTLRWTISSGACTPTTSDVIIVSSPTPTASNAGTNQTLCNTTTTTMAANTPGSGTGAWSVVSGSASVTTPSSPNSGVTGLTIGTSSILRWTISSGACTPSTSDVTVSVDESPTVADAGTNQNLCNTTTTTLAGNSPSVGTGSWSVISGSASITTPTSPTSGITGLTIGAASTLRWTISNGVCANSTDDVIVNVYDNPTTANAGTDQTLCNVTSATLAGNTPSVGTGAWSVVSGTATITDAADPTTTITGLTVGDTIVMQWTISSGTCTSTDEVTIIINELPSTADAGSNQNLCNVTTTTLSAVAPTIGAGTWSVISGSATVSSVNNPASAVTGLIVGGTAVLRWTVNNGVCPSSNSDMSINVAAPPTTSNAGSNQTACNITSANLSANTPASGTGNWSITSGTATITDASDPNTTITSISPGTSVTLEWTISNGGCTPSSSSVTIQSDAQPAAANAGPDQGICNGTSATLAGNTPTAGTGVWSFVSGSATITDVNDPATTVTGLSAGSSYTLKWKISNGVCPSDSDEVVLNVENSLTPANAGPDQELCNVTSTTLAGNTAIVGTGEWTIISGSATITDPLNPTTTLTGLTPGTGVVMRWTISSPSCTSNFNDMSLFVYRNPTTSNAGPNQNLCNVTSTTLAGNSPAIGTGLWSIISGTASITSPSSPNSQVTGLTPGDTITLRWTISNGTCPSSSSEMTIIDYKNPTLANAGPTQNLCGVTTTTLAANSPTIGTGSWSLISGTATITTPSSPTSTVTGLVLENSATLRWTISNGTCPASTSNVIINTDSTPTVSNAGPNQTLCNVTTATLAANTPTIGTGQWSVISGTASITTPTSPNSGVTNLTVGAASVLRWRITKGNCISQSNVTITVTPPPSTSVAGTEQQLCNVTTTTLAADSPSIGTGTWSVVSGAATIANLNSPTSSVSGLVIGDTATLRWTVANGVCTPSASDVLVIVSAPPTTASTGIDQELCNQTIATLSANTPTTGTGIWNVQTGPASVTDVNDPNSGVTGLVPGTSSTFRWTISSGFCASSSSETSIASYELPTTSNAGTDQNLCNATSTTLDGNTVVSGTGNWSVVAGTVTITDPSLKNTTITDLIPGDTVTLKWTISNGTCTPSEDEVVIFNAAPPEVAVAGPSQNLCNVTSSTLSANTPVTGTGNWTVLSGTATVTDPADPASGVTNLTIGGKSVLQWNITNGSCSISTDTLSITSSPTPSAAFAGADQSLCNVSSTTLDADAAIAGTGIWSVISGTATIDAPADPKSTISGLIAGDTIILRWTISSGSCTPSTDDVQVINYELPTIADAGTDINLCGSTSTTLSGNTPITGTGLWTIETGSAVIADATNPASSVSNITFGAPSVLKWTISNGSCVVSFDTVRISAFATPTTANAGLDIEICNGTNTTLSGNTAINGTGTWSVISGTATISSVNAPNSDVTGLIVGDTAILRWTISSGSCTPSTDDVTVISYEEPTIADAGTDQDICNTSTAVMAANTPAAGTGTWSLSNGTATITDVNDPATTITGLNSGATVTLMWRISNGVCTSTEDEVTVKVGQALTVADAGSDQGLCNTTGTNLSGNIPIVGQGSWSVISGTASVSDPSSPTSAVTNLTIGDTSVVRWSITSVSCGSSTDDVLLIVYELPSNADAGTDQNLCDVNSSSLSAVSPLVGTGTWTVELGPGTVSDPTNPASSITGLIPGQSSTVRWTVSNGTCVSTLDDIIINNYVQPASNAGTDQQLCNTSSASLAGNTPIAGTGSWSIISGSGTLSNANDPFSNITGIAIGDTVIAQWTLINGTCPASNDDLQIIVYEQPATASAGSNQNLCNTTAATLAGTAASAGSGIWTLVSGTGTVTDPANPSSDITGLTIGQPTTLQWTVSNGSCPSSSSDVVLTVFSQPVANAGPDKTLCNSGNDTLSAVPVTGTGTWSVVSGTANITSPNDPFTTLTGLVAGSSVTLKWKVVNGTCLADSDNVVINVNEAPTTANAGTNQQLCNVTTTNLSANTPTVGTGTWSKVSGSGTISNASDPASGVTGLSPGSTSVFKWTISNGICPNSASNVTIKIDNLPTTANAGIDQTICNNSGTSLSANAAAIGTGLWSVVSGTANVSSANDPFSAVTGLTAGNSDTLVWTISNGVCPPSTDTMVINTTPSPTANAGVDQTVCANNNLVSLNGSVTVATGGVWTTSGTGAFADSSQLVTSYIPSTADTAAGLAILTLTTTGNGTCAAVYDTMTVIITPAPFVSAGADINSCSNNSPVSLNGIVSGGASTGKWTTSGSGTFAPNDSALNANYVFTPSDTAAGNIFIILTSADNGNCVPVSDTLIILFGPSPAVFAGNDVTVCANNANVSLSGTVSGGSNKGKWTTTGTGSFSPNDSSLNVTYVPSTSDKNTGNVTITLTSTSNGNCLAVSDSLNITITPAPVVSAGSNQTVCANNATITLNGSVSGGASKGKWTTSGSGVFSPNDSTLNATYTPSASDTSSGTVTLTLTSTDNGLCLPVSSSMQLIITPKPTVNAGADQLVCGNANLNGNISGGAGTGKWGTSGTGSFSPNDTTLNAQYIPTAADTSSGFVTLVLSSTNNGGCNPVNDTMILSFVPPPVVNAGPDKTVCASNANVQLNGSVSGSTNTGQWSSTGSGIFSPGSSQLNTTYVPSFADTTAGTVYLILTSTNGCALTDTMMVTIMPSTLVNAGQDVFVCKTNPVVQLNGSVNGITTTGLWSTLGSGLFNPNDSALNATYSPSTSDTTTGFVNLVLTSTNNGNCMVKRDTVKINYTTPPVINAGANQTVCASNPLVLNGSITGGSGSGTWTTNGTGSFSPNANTLNASYTFTANDTVTKNLYFILTASNFAGCTVNPDTVEITVTPGPQVATGMASNITVCANNDTIVLNGSVSGVTNTGKWSTTGNGVFIPNDSTLNAQYVPSSNDKSNGTVTLILSSTNNSNCTSVSDSVVVTITPAPVVNAGTDKFICNGDLVQLSGAISGGTNTGTWTTDGTGTFSPDNNTLNTTYSPTASDTAGGSIIFVLTSTNNGNCIAVSDTMQAIFKPAPFVDAGADQTVCANNSDVTLSGVVSGSTTTGIWISSGTGTFIPDSVTLNATYKPSASDKSSGSVKLYLTSTNSCAITDSLLVTITPSPIVNAGPDQFKCISDSTASVSGTVTGGATSGIWSTSGSGYFIPNTDSLNALYVLSDADSINGSVTLTLTSTNNGNCLAVTDNLTVTLTTIPSINAGTDQTICANTSANIAGTISGGSGKGIWSTMGTGFFSPSDTSLTTTYTPSTGDTSAHNVKLILTSADACVTVRDTVEITITPAPRPKAGTDQFVCANNALVTLNGMMGGPGFSGIWSTTGDGSFSDTTSFSSTYLPGLSDTAASGVNLTLTSGNNGNCLTETDTVRIHISPAPKVYAGPDKTVCANNNLTTISGTVSGSFRWPMDQLRFGNIW
jgi:hypothetical protein